MNLPLSQSVILSRETLEVSSQAKDIKYSHYLFNKVPELQSYKLLWEKMRGIPLGKKKEWKDFISKTLY